MLSPLLAALVALALVAAHDHESHDQLPVGYVKYPWQATYPGDNEGMLHTSWHFRPREHADRQSRAVTADSIFSGITTFARLPWVQCLGKDADEAFDIAFIGAPFDTGTSYRTSAPCAASDAEGSFC